MKNVSLRCCVCAGLGLFAVGATALGQSVVYVPNGAETTAGTIGNVAGIGNAVSGTSQAVYSAAQMASVPPGSLITGMQLRLRNIVTSSWPASALTITKYDVTFADSPVTPATMTTTFASNMSNPVLVRSGALNLAAGAYPGGANTGTVPEGWGPVIAFTTPYVYGGGAMAVEIRSENPLAAGGSQADLAAGAGGGAGFTSWNSSSATTGLPVTANTGLAMRLTYVTPGAGPFQKGVTRLVILDDLVNEPANGASTSVLYDYAKTTQGIVAQSEMRRLGRGSRLIGMFYRGGSSTWPGAADFYARYDLQISKALTTPATMSNTVASNIGSDVTLVRSGQLDLAAGALLPVGPFPRPAPWALEIPFTTPYTYKGGGLMTLVRSSNIDSFNGGSPAALATSDERYGTRVRMRGSSLLSPDSTTTEGNVGYAMQMFSADSGTVTPRQFVETAGGIPAMTSFYAGTAQVVQTVIAAGELQEIPVGSQITGLTLRSTDANAWPASGLGFTEYRIDVSTAQARPFTLSALYANNEGSDKLRVRNGPLSVMKQSFPGGGNTFGATIHFDRPFVYVGGDLCITVRHSGSGSATTPASMDAHSIATRSQMITSSGNINAGSGTRLPQGPVMRVEYNPSVVVPVEVSATQGGVGYPILLSTGGNVHQSLYAEDQLRGLRFGSVITGVSLRRNSRVDFQGPDWPASDTVVNRFDITLSTSPVGPSAMSDTFASNIGADAIVVRSGPMTIPAKAFPYTESETVACDNEWFIQFTEPFVYNGGALSMTIRNDSGAGGTTFMADAFLGSDSVAAGRWSIGLGADATTHTNFSQKLALVARFAFVPKGVCAGDLNNDGIVEDSDFVMFASAYDRLDCGDPLMPMGCPADLTFDRFVDDTDFVLFVSSYDALVCP